MTFSAINSCNEDFMTYSTPLLSFHLYGGRDLVSDVNLNSLPIVELMGTGPSFSKVPKTFQARKAIRKTATRSLCKADLFIYKGNKN